ncbi:hypothetical protein PIB30_065339 [Stylosanthes scabra]|uniref:Leucine-rich repeat-containing N-terminal plant-type domain-containing protein n=1 Tax=Stylosanthes scabra TaxID=79078 RepID=A0ABU6TP51_9FABA|nr:hypothetical protein [Stylosanthes scabra]
MGYLIRVVLCVHVFMLFHFFACLSSHSCNPEERTALLHFKTQHIIHIPFSEFDYGDECPHAYPKMKTWDNGTDCCSWMGVTCDSVSGHVIGLDLSCSGLEGNIDPNSTLFQLTHLHTLNLAHNDFYGSELPSQFGLNLKETTLKRLLQNATTLRKVILDGIDLSLIGSRAGPLSLIANMSSSLITLSLARTEIRGSLTNDVLCSFPNLQNLNLAGNPDMLISFSKLSCHTSLSILDLSFCGIQGNNLSGQIPNVFERLPNLQTLSLRVNNLQGKLPSSLFTLTRLSQLDCSYNQIEGPLPDQIAFSNFTDLILNDNLFNGTIPSWALSFKSLRYLDLSNNRFTGHINSEITSNSLEYLDLCGNKLEGHLPESVFHLVNLTNLCLSLDNWSSTVHFPLFSKLQNLQYLSLSGCSSLLLESEMSVNYTFSNLNLLQLIFSNIIGYSKFSGKFPVLEYLELTNNKLEGKVPKWIHDIPSLRYLNLSHNNFTSIGHPFPWYQLEGLDLSFNSMDDDIFSFFCNITSVNVINLSHNRFTGTFPQCLANSSSLRDLDLQMNKLHGNLPDAFKDLPLETLNLYGNQFGGLLPKSLSNCTDLVDLNLGNNQFEDTFPNWLENLSYLEILVLRGNKLYGSVINLKSQNVFPRLIIFDISCNNFGGSLPKAYIKIFQAMKIQSSFYYYFGSALNMGEGIIHPQYDNSIVATTKGVSIPFEKIPENFVIIDLSGNKFEGEIPDVIGELQALKGLNLSNNRLVGHIPHSLGNLTNLESLDLSSNMLTGEIPAELTNLNFLEVLHLSQNQLVGSIPKGKQFNTFSNDSYMGNMGLCGLPLSLQCNNNVSQQEFPSAEAEDKFGFGWKPVAIGYAFGTVFGIGLGWCVFWIGKPEWLVIIFGGTTTRIKRRSRENRRARTTS